MENCGGIYKGFVYDNKDPNYCNRLMLKIPAIYGDDVHEYWALPRGQYAGKGYGLVMTPSIGDAVWVMFEGGDPMFPVWEHGWFADNELPKEAKSDGMKRLVIQSISGQRLVFDPVTPYVKILNNDTELAIFDKDGLHLVSDSINIGSMNASEPAVLGDTTAKLVLELIDDIGGLDAIQTSSGITGKVNTSISWNALVLKWKTKIDDIKSKKVRLD